MLKLLQKGRKWKWEEKHQNTFTKSKELFQNNLQLLHPSDEGTYVLQMYASDTANSVVLYQHDANSEHQVITYVNQMLKGSEKNYFIS